MFNSIITAANNSGLSINTNFNYTVGSTGYLDQVSKEDFTECDILMGTDEHGRRAISFITTLKGKAGAAAVTTIFDRYSSEKSDNLHINRGIIKTTKAGSEAVSYEPTKREILVGAGQTLFSGALDHESLEEIKLLFTEGEAKFNGIHGAPEYYICTGRHTATPIKPYHA